MLNWQKLACRSEAAVYNDYTIAPLTRSLERTETCF
jgi:hypothetical protein